jgi:hypothetical protein
MNLLYNKFIIIILIVEEFIKEILCVFGDWSQYCEVFKCV